MRRLCMIAAVLVLAVSGCAAIRGEEGSTDSTDGKAASAAEDGKVNFATGRQGGSQYPISVALTQILEKNTPVESVTLTPGGGAANVAAVGQGQSQLGITLSMSAVDGYSGKPPYEEPTKDATHLFSLHPFNLVILASADSGIDRVEDLRGKTVNVGPAGFTTVEVAKLVFNEVYGFDKGDVTLENLEITDAVEQFKNGQLDALFYLPSDRYAPYIDLAETRDLKIVPIDQEHRQKLLDAHPSFYETEFPIEAGIYQGLDEPVPTVGFANTIIANRQQVDKQLGYEIVKAVAENFEQVQAVEPSLKVLQPRDLANPVNGMPVHPGAKQYFEEQGWTG